jgi:hypothetical protein
MLPETASVYQISFHVSKELLEEIINVRSTLSERTPE